MSYPHRGETFGRYSILGELGRGGMGVVLHARQTDLDREVALKVLSPELVEQAEFAARFRREAGLLASVDSPHIIAIYDHGEHDGRLFIATQLVRGGDLAQHLRGHGPLSLDQGLDLAAQLASALNDAHGAGVLHRDVKPSNVLLRQTEDGWHAYLCDFGIAHTGAGELTQAGTVVGTYGYLAPERCEGEPATEGSDIYALGCLIVATLSGDAPYAGSDFQVAQQHLSSPVPQWEPTFSGAADLNEVLRRSMAKRPEDRYRSASEMRRAILAAREAARHGGSATVHAPRQAPERTVLRAEPPPPATPTPSMLPIQPPRRGPSTAAVVLGTSLVLILLAALAIGGYVAFRPSRDDTTAAGAADHGSPAPTSASRKDSTTSSPSSDPAPAASSSSSGVDRSVGYPRRDLPCSGGGYVVVLGSTFSPTTVDAEYQGTMREFDSASYPASYAVTQSSCSNLGKIQGAGIGRQIPYLGPFDDAQGACQARLDVGTTSTYIAEVDGGTSKINCSCAFDAVDLPDLGPGPSTDERTKMWVIELQAMLGKGVHRAFPTTGTYAEKTTTWVRDLQARHSLPATGSMDPESWEALKKDACY